MTKEKRDLIILIVLGSLGLFIGLHFIFVGPGRLNLKKATSQLVEKTKELKQKQSIARKYSSLLESKAQADAKIKNFSTTLISDTEFEFFRNTIRDMGAEYEVKIMQDHMVVIPDKQKTVFKEDPQYTEKEIRLNVICRYHDFGSFLNRLENTSEFRKVTTFNVRKESSGDKGTSLLRMELTILSLIKEQI